MANPLHWLRTLVFRSNSSRRHQQPRRSKPRHGHCRLLQLERLEDRLAPAAHTWNPAASDGSWTNPANWSVGGAPAPGETNVQLTFSASAQTNVTNDVANLTFGSITFNAGAPAYAVNLDTATQNVQAGGLTITNNSAATETIAGAQALNLTDGLFVAGSGNITISEQLAGANGLTDNNTGTLTLSNAANTYTGTTNVNSGTLTVGMGGVLYNGTSGSVNLNTAGVSLNGAGTINGQVTLAASNNSGAANNTHVDGVTISVPAGGSGISVPAGVTFAQIGVTSGVTINGGSATSTGILVQGSAKIFNSSILGQNVDINVNGGGAALQDDTLTPGTGNFVTGLLVAGGAVVDAGQLAASATPLPNGPAGNVGYYGDITGLFSGTPLGSSAHSSGGNTFGTAGSPFTLDTAAAATTNPGPNIPQAIRNENTGTAPFGALANGLEQSFTYDSAGPQLGRMDTMAQADSWNGNASLPLFQIEQLVCHDIDDNSVGFVTFGNTTAPAPTITTTPLYTASTDRSLTATQAGRGTLVNGTSQGSEQMSAIRALQVTFSSYVFLDPNLLSTTTNDGINLLQLNSPYGPAGSGAGAVPQLVSVQVFSTTYNPTTGAYTVVFTFSGPATESGSLQDGSYSLNFNASAIDGGGPGGPGLTGTYASPSTYTALFHRLFGDSNGDSQVDASDIPAYLAAYGSDSSQANFRAAFDFNNDNAIDATDAAAFLARCNQRLNPDGTVTVLPLPTVYVDASWTGTTPGTEPANDPVGNLIFGFDAFADIPTGIGKVDAGGTVVVYGGTYGAVNVNKALTEIEAEVNTARSSPPAVVTLGAVTLSQDATFLMSTADLTFSSTVDDATAGTHTLSVNGSHAATFSGAVGGMFAPFSLTGGAGGSISLTSVTTTAAQTYNESAVTLNGAYATTNAMFAVTSGATTLAGITTVTTGTGAITFGGTLDGNFALSTTSNGVTTFGGTVGSPTPLAALTVNGSTTAQTINLNTALTLGSGTSTGALSLTAQTINLNGAIDTSAGTAGNVTLDNGAGDLTISKPINAGSATVALTSAGKVTQGGTGGITAGSLGIIATSTIDLSSSGAANDVATFAAQTGSGATSFSNTGDLTIGAVPAASSFAGVTGVSSAVGAITITSGAGLTVSDAITTATSSGNGIIVSGAGTITITANLTAFLATVNGTGNPDAFTITPSTGTVINVNGHLPPPMDSLDVNTAGLTNPVLSDTYSSTTGLSGTWSFGNAADVNFTGLATLLQPLADQTLSYKQNSVQFSVPAGSSVVSAGSIAFFLDQSLQLTFAGSYFGNYLGLHEIWLVGAANQFHNPWYYITPAGQLFAWDGTTTGTHSVLLGSLDPLYYNYPDLLYGQTSGSISYAQATLDYILQQRLHLKFKGNYFLNYGGRNEKWLQGNVNQYGNDWYFIDPAGNFYAWDGTIQQASGTLLASLDPLYWAQPQRLFNAQPNEVVADLPSASGTLTITTTADWAGRLVVQVTPPASAAQTYTLNWVDHAAVVAPIPGQTLVAGTPLQVNVSASDADGDPVTLSAEGGSLGFVLQQSLGLRLQGSLFFNYGGANEEWLRGQAGAWYFIKPDGSFWQWDGTPFKASGTQIATLDPIFYYHPDMLYLPAAGDEAFAINQELDLTQQSSTFSFNYGGANEKWLLGNDGWYFIKPDGTFYKWDGTLNKASGTLMASLDPDYYANIQRLYQAQPNTVNVSLSGSTLTLTPTAGFIGDFWVLVQASDGIQTTSQYFDAGAPYQATVNGFSAANVAVTANVTLATNQTAGLVARYSGPADQNMYLGQVTNLGAGTSVASIWRDFQGTWTQLFSQDVGGASGSLSLEFDLVGPSLKLFIDGTALAYADDTMLTAPGTVGLRASSGVTFGNLTASTLVVASQSLPFFDNFATPGPNSQLDAAEGWLNQAGNFTDNGSVATGVGTINVATLNGVSARNTTLEADVTVTSGQFAGLVSRYTGADDSNMYFGGLFSVNGGFELQIWRNLNGTWTMLTSAAVGSGSGTLQLVTNGSTLSLSLGGGTPLTISDSQISGAGTVGMRASAGATLANFSAM